jgi:hypothetical protein
VYAVALYVEGEPAAKELGIRARGGFFESDDDFCAAIVDGAFNKALVVRGLCVARAAALSERPRATPACV